MRASLSPHPHRLSPRLDFHARAHARARAHTHTHTDHLNETNMRLKDTLQKAGGATNIVVKLILLVLLFSIGAYIYMSIQ